MYLNTDPTQEHLVYVGMKYFGKQLITKLD